LQAKKEKSALYDRGKKGKKEARKLAGHARMRRREAIRKKRGETRRRGRSKGGIRRDGV